MHADWPGKVRELQNFIERAVVMATAQCLIFDRSSDSLLPQNVDLRQVHDLVPTPAQNRFEGE
jgi:DNA-binding NtrC family response regulator